jgi:hypothetical protein
MKPVIEMNPNELRNAAYQAIQSELGPVGLMRFVLENGLGSGDYTKEREALFADIKTVDDLTARMEEFKRSRQGSRALGE